MAKCSREQRDRAVDLYVRYERCAADVDWLQCIRQSDEGRMTWDWRPTMADPKHPRHYDEAFKRQIVQSCESGKPSRGIRAEYDIARSTPRCRYSHEGRHDTGQLRPLPDISAMQDAGRSRSTYYWMTGHPGTERADCVSASWCPQYGHFFSAA